jgi:hypothetical protein
MSRRYPLIAFRIPPEEREQLRDVAKAQGLSISDVMRKSLRLFFALHVTQSNMRTYTRKQAAEVEQ